MDGSHMGRRAAGKKRRGEGGRKKDVRREGEE